MRHSLILSAIAFLASCHFANAFETGQTVRIAMGGKSVFVKDSSLDENKPAVLWTETNVNAQRWTLTGKANGTFLLTNEYTGYYLAGLTSGSSGKVGQMSRSAAGSKGSWDFVPVEGTTDQYRIYQGTTQRYALAVPEDPSEGDTLCIVNIEKDTNIDPARITWTVEAVEQMENAFTKDKRDDMMEKWKERAYKKASTGWVIGNGGWWGDAEMFEIVLDALETTGDQQYATMFENLYTNFLSRNGSTWYQKGVSGYNEYNDDIAWMCIACIRAYLLTGTTKYRTTAKTNFDGMFKRADCYGNDLLQWKHSSDSKGTNSCINGPAAVCACYLAIAQADTSYYQKARKTYLAERATLFEMSGGKPTGAVWDSYDQGTGNYNKWCSTYNQGTNLGAAIMLYNHYGETMFKEDADAIIKWSEANMANSKGIIHVCQTVSGDLTNFKGIMLRYLRMYAETFNAPSHYAWIAKNAYHAWNNRNSSGITSSAWLTKAEEDFRHLEGTEYKNFGNDGNMTCVSAAFNCHLGAVDSHEASAQNPAEAFNFVRGAQVSEEGNTDDGSGMAELKKSNQYIGYRRVNFGTKPASHIGLRLNISLGTTGINVFLDQPNTKSGTLLCSVKGNELAARGTWETIQKMINLPVTGVHDVYFVSTGSGQTSINWWQFQSQWPVFADLTNGPGTLATSLAAENPEALIDDDTTTATDIPVEEGSETWIQYTFPSPVILYGYQFFSGLDGAGDPKGWSLEASDNGKDWETLQRVEDVTFSVRAERYSADINAAKAYTHYRLLFDFLHTGGETEGGQDFLSISEWQLLGRFIAEDDLTADGGTMTEGCEPLGDHQGTTALATPITAVYRTKGIYTLYAYSITASAASEAPTDWKLEGSENGTTWRLIDQQTEAVFPYDACTNVWSVAPATSYLYYRLTITGEGARLTQWQLFGKHDYGTYYADITGIASVVGSDETSAETLVDDDANTFCHIEGDNPYWDITVPIPVKPLGFSLVSGENAELDPQDVTLSALDEDGTETVLATKTPSFPARGARRTFTVSSTKLFTHFRLKVSHGEAPEQSGAGMGTGLADFELYGTAIAGEDDKAFVAPSRVTASADGLSSTEQIERINDGNRSTNYRAAFTEPVSITFDFDHPVRINAYGITAGKADFARDPADWVLEGTLSDTDTWHVIDSRAGEKFSHHYATQFYMAGNDEAYSTYRLTVNATGGAEYLQIGEVQLLSIEPSEGTDAIHGPALRDGQGGKEGADKVYDLVGRGVAEGGTRTGKLPRGIYIIGGKKLLIR